MFVRPACAGAYTEEWIQYSTRHHCLPYCSACSAGRLCIQLNALACSLLVQPSSSFARAATLDPCTPHCGACSLCKTSFVSCVPALNDRTCVVGMPAFRSAVQWLLCARLRGWLHIKHLRQTTSIAHETRTFVTSNKWTYHNRDP
jgi:hypothetical protein